VRIRLSSAPSLLAACATVAFSSFPIIGIAAPALVDATLPNGMRVVIVPNALAPVVSTDLVYKVGSRDDPADFPGMAHAQEHMMFRGTKALSTGELGTIATALGGSFNAETSDTLTQYEFTVPAADLDAVLRIEADRMRDVLDAQNEWVDERGAIEQEVLRDESAPGGDFFRDAQAVALAGTPYARPGVGTRAAFERLTGADLHAFHAKWYAPNNAVLVVAGDVDPASVLARVRERFGAIARKTMPAHPTARLRPLARTVMRRTTTLVYPLAAVGFRLPGVESPDFIASFVLQQILGSSRGPLRALVDTGRALDGEWISMPYVPEAQLGYATAALGPAGDPVAMLHELETILQGFARAGVPKELFETTKHQAITGQELSRNSISALASDWATTIALDREPSIAREQELLGKVTLADVDRVARTYLSPAHAIVAALQPSAGASQNAPPAPAAQGPEKPLAVKPATTQLPSWAAGLISGTSVPASNVSAERSTLPNGITFVYQRATISDSVFLYGDVRSNPALEEPAGKEGVSAILNATYDFGTRDRDRTAFVRAQDEIDTELSLGSSRFAMQTTAKAFERGASLLAEGLLRPKLDATTFEAARSRTAQQLQTLDNGTASVANRRAAEKLYPAGDPALREPTVAGLGAITPADVAGYYAKTIQPNRTTIVVVGNVAPGVARRALEQAFAGWKTTSEAPNLDLPRLALNAPADVHVAQPALGQASVRLEQILTTDRRSPDYDALSLGNVILGGGSGGPEQSRLFRNLRQNAGLVYSVESQVSAGRTRAQFSVDFASSPQNVERITGLVAAEVAKLRSEPVGAFELSLAKASIVRRSVVAGGSIGSIGSALLSAASDGEPLDADRRSAERILATDASAVRSAFATYVHPENFVRVTVGP